MENIYSSEELTKYYNQINNIIDEYIEEWKIRPTRLKKYLKPNTKRFKSFLKQNNLEDIQNIDKIINDVLEDRVGLEKDRLLSFENFKTKKQ